MKPLHGAAGRSSGADRGKLSKVTQLTGFSDPVYAEAIVAVNQYDIVLDVLVVNQTGTYIIPPPTPQIPPTPNMTPKTQYNPLPQKLT